MLVLARKLGESIQIGNGIVVKVVEVRRGRVRLGIAAPPAVRIQRQEHLEKPESCELVDGIEFGAATAVC